MTDVKADNVHSGVADWLETRVGVPAASLGPDNWRVATALKEGGRRDGSLANHGRSIRRLESKSETTCGFAVGTTNEKRP